jgi:hypothetical protein
MHLNPEKRPAGPPKSGKTQKIVVDDVSLAGFWFQALCFVPGARPSTASETTIDMNNNKDDLKDVQPYPLELWPETRPAVGRSSSGEQLYPYQVAVVLGRAKLAKIEVALTKWEEYQVKLMGEQLRKEGACRGLDIRAAKFVSPLSEFQASEFQTKDRMFEWIEEVLAGQRLQKAERAKKAKAARERRRWEGTGRREGNSPLSRRGEPIGD